MKAPKIDYATMLFRRTANADVSVEYDHLTQNGGEKSSTYDNHNINEVEDEVHFYYLFVFVLKTSLRWWLENAFLSPLHFPKSPNFL